MIWVRDMNKVRSFLIWFFVFSATLCASVSQSYIVLSTEKTKEGIEEQISKYEQAMNENNILKRLQKTVSFQIKVIEKNDVSILKTGPFFEMDTLALAFLELRPVFPYAFIVEDIRNGKISPSKIKYITKPIVIEQEDENLWIALFGLGVIGILSLFLSSDQIKNLREKHQYIQSKQKEIEKKQSLLLEKMGEKIQTVATKSVDDEIKLLEAPLETIDAHEIKNRIENLKKYDEVLLRTTYEMIDFLKIKSGNIVIKQEAFQLSNMLHKLTNAVADSLKSKEHTLYYNIKYNVTRYLIGDTVRIYQVLHNLLSDVFAHKEANDVILHIEVREEEELVFTIESTSLYLTPKEIDRLFIPSSWEEVQNKHKEFGFFVIKELIANMDGKFLIDSHPTRGTRYELILPYIRDVDNKSHKKDLIKVLASKKALLFDTDMQKAEMLTKILNSFDIDVIFKSSRNLETYRPNLDGFDFLILKNEDISKKVFQFLKNIDKKQNIDIIVINNIFETRNEIDGIAYISDATLYSPLIIGDVEEVLKQLCIKKARRKKDIRQVGLENFKILDVAKVTMSDFQKFSDKTILIVEDNLVSQQVMSSILSASNLNILKAENGQEALDILEESTKIDLIFMDMNMPIMDGFEATKKIRQNSKYKKVPIIAVTGLGFNYEVEQMIFAGVDACIIKPSRVGQLYTALDRFLNTDQFTNTNKKAAIQGQNENKMVLDISKGMGYVRSETFYNEIVVQILLALKNSQKLVKEMIQNDQIDELRSFCVDALGLSATIGATGYVSLLKEMLMEMKKEEIFISQYIPRYKESWLELEAEMKRYLKQ